MADRLRVMGIDPSSTETGWALLKGLEPEDLEACGTVTASPCREHDWEMPRWLAKMHAVRALAAYRRVTSMILQLRSLVGEHKPNFIVVEIPSGRPGTGSKAGASSSLTVYGMAAGRVAEALRGMYADGRVIAVTEQVWIGSRGPKQGRMQETQLLYGEHGYDISEDSGGDKSDAINLARWFYEWQPFFEADSGGVQCATCAVGGD